MDYLSVVRTGNDGICVHTITGQSAGTGLNYIWTGDIGKACGVPWYEQRKSIKVDARDPYMSACVWIDGNAESGHIWTGFSLHLGSFGGSKTDDGGTDDAQGMVGAFNNNKDLLCASEPRFSMCEDIEIGNQVRTFIDLPRGEFDSKTIRIWS